ncbi:hypothetical protein [Parvibium lacunae]|uniref:Sugar transporter n=1 Tax=Parvibium lacunae TaxID=1888893 RepID=A0A368KYX4_9BURK|nr:hypothetical protein [Parvibium lacunae]RCS56593.1 hypothetical protein DU000_11565 [Parvibium lacunae]
MAASRAALLRLLSLVLCLVLQSACGQRGGLYLPPKPGQSNNPPLAKPVVPAPASGEDFDLTLGAAIPNIPLKSEATPATPSLPPAATSLPATPSR